jgi:hypothetical protein
MIRCPACPAIKSQHMTWTRPIAPGEGVLSDKKKNLLYRLIVSMKREVITRGTLNCPATEHRTLIQCGCEKYATIFPKESVLCGNIKSGGSEVVFVLLFLHIS